jgi:hypothetical protein
MILNARRRSTNSSMALSQFDSDRRSSLRCRMSWKSNAVSTTNRRLRQEHGTVASTGSTSSAMIAES